MTCPKGFKIVKEGLAEACVPDPDLYRRSDGVYEPAWAPVFYNPAMVTNRDIASAFIQALKSLGERVEVVLDAMCSTGIRGVRIAKEVREVKVFMVDIDSEATKIARLNAELNNVSNNVHVEECDCREFMYRSLRTGLVIDYIDVDPFGSPAPFVQAALEAVRGKGVVGFTATDLAPLEGKYPKKLYRRYGVVGKKVGASKHVAIRNLLAFIARVGAVVDRYIVPLYSYYDRHYIRVYVRVYRGKGRSYECLDKCLGSIAYCNNCSYWEMGKVVRSRCPVCGAELDIVSNTWICTIVDLDVAKKVLGIESVRVV